MNQVLFFLKSLKWARTAVFLGLLFPVLFFYYWLGQDWPMEWADEAHFSAVTESLMRGSFPSVPELSAEKGIFWMPFFSNLIHALIYKISGVSSIYLSYTIRPYVVLPVIAAIYFSLFKILKYSTNSDLAALLLTILFLILPASAGPLNTVRQEGLCIFLISLALLLWITNNSISSALTAVITLLTHPLAGVVSLMTLSLCVGRDLACTTFAARSNSSSQK